MSASGPVGDYEFAVDNVYGHTVELLRDTLGSATPNETRVHLDLACGFARVAPAIEEQLGLTYVGVDVDATVLASARARGLEAHAIDLDEDARDDALLSALVTALAGRRLASISLIDSITEFRRPRRLLRVIASLAAQESAVVIVTAPNVAHRDVGYKLAFGAFDAMPSGLLSERHLTLFSAARLTEMMVASGLHRIAERNVERSESDQHFPVTHTALSRGTSLNRFLDRINASADGNGRVQQFVWACLPGPAVEHEPPVEPSTFLTVMIRTLGRRPQELAEVFLSLAGQSDQDFEVVVLGHNLNVDDQLVLEQLIDDVPVSLRERIRLHRVDHGTRATLLNVGFELGRGEYVCVLDDDDLVFAHWVESFKKLARHHRGKILRSTAVLQEATRVVVRGRSGIRAQGTLQAKFDPEFEYVKHLSQNQSPFMTLAFPIGLYRDLGMRFDESLTTTEDWDFLMRSAPYAGVADSREVVAIYHWWIDQVSSRTDHDAEEWRLNQLSVDRKLDAQPILLPAGESRLIREMVRRQLVTPEPIERVCVHDTGNAAAEMEQSKAERDWLLHRIAALLESNSWRLTAPVRAVTTIFRRGRSARMSELAHLSIEDLRHVLLAIESSRSWRHSRHFRRLRRRG